jgi:beta-lactamase superfamily II metal-dependent hydrolase
MRASIGWLSILALSVAVAVAAPGAQTRPAPSGKTLDIYVVDVEGGNATLFVSPSGGSVLIDTGNGGAAAVRDAERIMAAVKAAGLTQIDNLITTHWHGDHFGAMAELTARIPIQRFIDHGGNVQPAPPADDFLQKVYPTLYAKGTHVVAKPGDKIAVAGLDWRIVTSAGATVKTPLPGGGKPNPYCAGFKPQEADKGENAQSVGSVVTYGKFRVAHLGDVTWNKEFDLMCPNNPIGTVDLFVVSHHGQAISNSEALVHALAPRVGIINNGTRKGGQPDAMRILHSSPGIEDLWQLHFSQLSGQEYTVPGMFIANSTDEPLTAMPVAGITAPPPGPGAPPPPAHNGAAYWVKVSAQTDGSFTVTNARNGFSKTYRAR